MNACRTFERRLESLAQIVEFTAAALCDRRVDAAPHQAIDFAIEELFTNMIKYSRSGANRVEITIDCDEAAIAVTLVDIDVEPFDVTAAPDADVALPLPQRRPGGLGLHLVRRLVQGLSYEYRETTRESRICFCVPCRRPN